MPNTTYNLWLGSGYSEKSIGIFLLGFPFGIVHDETRHSSYARTLPNIAIEENLMNEEIQIYLQKKKTTKLFLLAPLISFLGIQPLKSDLMIMNIIGALCVLTSILCISVGISVLLRKRPVIILETKKGIIDKRILNGFIPWEKIEQIEFIRKKNQSAIKLTAKNNFMICNFKIWCKTISGARNGKNKTVIINLSMTDAKQHEIENFVNNYKLCNVG